MTQKELDFRDLYEKYKDKVYRLCLGFVQDEDLAKDLFQEILIKVWNHLESFRGESEIGTWLYRVAYNTASKFADKEKRRFTKTTALPWDLDFEEEKSSSSQTEMELKQLYQAIAELPESDRLIATLLLEGMPYKTISEIAGISENYVAVKVNRIKSILSKKITRSYGN